MPVAILQDVRIMRGRTKARLMAAEDGNYYVVKFQTNPLGRRSLVNDFAASSVALSLGLSVARAELVELSESLWEIAAGGSSRHAGLHFGSRFVVHPRQGQVVDYFPDSMFDRLANPDVIAGAFVFDFWMRNSERQFVYYRIPPGSRYVAVMIDQGGCFGGTEWNVGVNVSAQNSEWPRMHLEKFLAIDRSLFEFWVSRIASCPEELAAEIMGTIPSEWLTDERGRFEVVLRSVWDSKPTIEDVDELLALLQERKSGDRRTEK